MSDQEREALEQENADVSELDDSQLEDVAGGGPNLACDEGCVAQQHL